MADRPLSDLLRHLRRTALPSAGVLPDAELLRRFVGHHDEAAFEALVWRHGPLVAGVCRRVLGRTPDAEDAFQATFLVLARKAGSIRAQTAVGPWLYRVAFRVALRARERAAQADRVQPLPDDLPAPAIPDDAERRDQMRVLDEEVQRLPAKYRETVVLRYLEGLSTTEVADILKCPPGTVLSRLAWARQRLRRRLSARGVTLSTAVAIAAATGREAGAVPVRWVAAVAGVALRFAPGGSSGVGLTRPALLAEGVLQAMLLTKLQVSAALTLGVLITGAGLMLPGHTAVPSDGQPPAAAEQPVIVTVTRPIVREKGAYEDMFGRIEAAVTVEVCPNITGQLQKIAFRPGAEVKRGDLLFELDARRCLVEVEMAQAELKRAEARLKRATADLDRVKLLQSKQAIGQDEVDKQTGDRDEAAAAVQIAQVGIQRARLDLDATRITAPVAGRAGRPLLDVGNMAGPTTPVVNLVSTEPAYVAFEIEEEKFLRMRKLLENKPGGLVGGVLIGLCRIEEGFPRRGQLEFVDNHFDAKTGRIRVRVAFPKGGDELTPGMSVLGRVMTGEPLMLVPDRAVMAGSATEWYVFVVDSTNKVEARAVVEGQPEGNLRIIRKGLRADDRVIIDGLPTLMPGKTVQIREADVKK